MLHVHRSASADVLVTELGRRLADPVGDPFAAEVVAVPAKGVERWLAQRLSHLLGAGSTGAGICANVHFSSPTRLLDDALRAAGGGVPEGAEADPWDPARAVWPLLAILDAGGGGKRIDAHLAGGDRRYAVAARLAAIFADYGQERPALLRGWVSGTDGSDVDDRGEPLPADLAWQPTLWRRLRAELGVPSPAERLPAALARLAEDPGCVDLPDRFSVFGMNRLSRTRLDVLATLAQHREIRLWIQHASPALWAATATGSAARHPLLRSMSRDVRALQGRLAEAAPGHGDHLHSPGDRPATLLGRLQAALADDAEPAERPVLDPADDSIVVHACHGRARQVEVLRESILERLSADPTLEPRDILVMCPDIEQFAPLVAAAFAERADAGGPASDAHPASQLRVRLADRALRQANPLFATLSTLLDLARERVTAADVLDLAATAPVRRRFGFDPEDAERLADWVADAGISWGVDQAHRDRYRLPTAQGTWRSGLDCLLLGVAMEGGQTWLGPAVPIDDVDSATISLAGRFAEFVDRLGNALAAIAKPHAVAEWVDLLTDAVLSIAAPGAGEAWQSVSLASELEDLRDAAAGSTTPLTPGDVAALLAGRLAGRPTRANFRSGTLTVATLVPMRSVPHRVIALLGLDDGTFPRAGVVDGDDLLARAPRPGERDPRTEDRQLLLDAIGSAGEHLLVFYSGADERSGAVVPPAVPVGELLDALDGVARAADGRPVADHVTIRHPLQAFDPRNFGVDLPGVPAPIRRPVSFDAAALAGAKALLSPRVDPRTLIDGTLPARPLGPVELGDLMRLLVNPARGFLRQRLELGFPDEDTDPPDSLPVELDGLAEWAIGDRILGERLRGTPIDVCIQLERRRGALPPAVLGRQALSRIGSRVDAITTMVAGDLAGESRVVDIDVEVLVGGVSRRLTGTVGGVRGRDALRVEYSTLKAKQRLTAWIELLALVAMHPEDKWRATVVGRRGNKAVRRQLGPVDADHALDVLGELIAVRDEGLRRPLPMPVATAERYASAVLRGVDHRVALDEAEDQEWGGRFPERRDDAWCLTFGPEAPLKALGLQEFSDLARRVWEPLLRAES